MADEIIAFQGKQIKVTKDEYDTFVKSIAAQEATETEIKLYLYDCDRRGVSPLDKLIHFTKRKGRYTPVTSIDYMRIRAESSGVYAGSDDAVFEEGTKYPKAAKVTVWKMVKDRLGRFEATARWDEYAPDLTTASAFMWKKMPHTMLAKCAEALALRKAFPGQLAGLYSKEEMAQDGRYIEESDAVAIDGIAKPAEKPQEQQEGEEAPEAIAETQELADGYTGAQILANKHGQMAALIELTGKAVVDICHVVGSLEKGKKFTLQQIAEMMKEGD